METEAPQPSCSRTQQRNSTLKVFCTAKKKKRKKERWKLSRGCQLLYWRKAGKETKAFQKDWNLKSPIHSHSDGARHIASFARIQEESEFTNQKGLIVVKRGALRSQTVKISNCHPTATQTS